MSEKKQVFALSVIFSIFGGVTYYLLLSSTQPQHLGLDCLAGALNNLPFKKIESAIYLGVATLFLYPPLLRPVVVTTYSLLPRNLKVVARKFIFAANIRVFILGAMFSVFAGVLIASGIYDASQRTKHFINVETLLGLLCILMALAMVNIQAQMTLFRRAVKERGLLEGIIQIVLLIVGVLAVGQAFIG